MLLMMLENGMQIDEIVFCDTGKEFPDMYHHIKQVENYIQRPITTIKFEKDFDYLMLKNIKTKGKSKGQAGYGWPLSSTRWCTTLLKRDLFQRYVKQKYAGDFKSYIGMAFDEPDRTENKKTNQEYPLFDWRVTEGEALKYCYEKGFTWGGLYTRFSRVSCYCCPFKSLKDLRALYFFYPGLWEDIKQMDKLSRNTFRNDYTLEELEKRFILSVNKEAS